MKKLLLISMISLTGVAAIFSQSKTEKAAKLKAHIIELEKSGWNAFKTKDASWFETNTTDAYLQVTSEGITNKADVIKSLAECDVADFAFDDFQMIILNKTAILLLYTVTQDGICGDERLPAKARVAVNYVKNNQLNYDFKNSYQLLNIPLGLSYNFGVNAPFKAD